MFLFPLKKIVSYSMGTNFNFLILLHCRMIYIYTFISKEVNYTFLHYQIYFDKKFQVILFKNISTSTRYAPVGSSYKFWIDSTPGCDSDAFKYFSKYYF